MYVTLCPYTLSLAQKSSIKALIVISCTCLLYRIEEAGAGYDNVSESILPCYVISVSNSHIFIASIMIFGGAVLKPQLLESGDYMGITNFI